MLQCAKAIDDWVVTIENRLTYHKTTSRSVFEQTPVLSTGSTDEAPSMNPNGRTLNHVTLEPEERTSLQEMVDSGKGAKEQRKRAHILLWADVDRPGGGYRDAAMADVRGAMALTLNFSFIG